MCSVQEFSNKRVHYGIDKFVTAILMPSAVSNSLIIALVVVESPYGEAMLIVSKQVRSKEECFNEVSWGVKNIFTSHPPKIYVEKNLILSLQNNCSLNFETAVPIIQNNSAPSKSYYKILHQCE